MTDDQMTGFDDPRAERVEGKGAPQEADPPKTTAVAAPSGGALTVVDLGEDAGAGLEDMRMEEQLTPILTILQKGSPQVDSAMPAFNEALRAGMIYNTATTEAYPGAAGVEVVVCARDYHYGMWVPRDAGGGFRGMMKPEDPAVRQGIARYGRFKKLPHVTAEGEPVELVETIQLYVLYAERDISHMNAQRAILSMTSTAMPVAQQYLTRHNSWRYLQRDGTQKPAQLWSYRWRFSLVPQQNSKGSWFNWKVDLLPPGAAPRDALIPRTDPLFALGREFYDLYRGGQVRADYSGVGEDPNAPPF